MMPDDTIEFGEPTIHENKSEYGYEWERGGNPMMRVMVSDVRNEGDNIYGEFTVWWLLDMPLGVRPIQPKTTLKLNTSNYQGWRSIPSALSKRFPNVDFEGAMTIVVDETMSRFEKGEDNIRLGLSEDDGGAPFILKPFIANAGTTVMYGEGGLSKSLIALAMAISVSSGVPIFGREPTLAGPVMYFDYEDDSRAHDVRMRALCHSFGIPLNEVEVYHHALAAKVTTAKREMTKRAEEVGAVLGILDSVGMGRGGSAIASEDTIRMFRALREVGIPFLAVDHVSKAEKEKNGADVSAYGSVYTMNSARLAWSLVRQATGKDEDLIQIHAVNTKANHVKKAPPQTIAIRYRNDDRGVPEFIDIETGNEFGMLMPTVGTHERVMMSLASHGEWRSYDQLADELGIKRETLKKAVSRDQQNDLSIFETKTELRKTWVRSVTTGVSRPVTDDVTDEGEE